MANKNKNISRLVKTGSTPEVTDLALVPTLTQPVYYAAREAAEKTLLDDRSRNGLPGENSARGRLPESRDSDVVSELEYRLEQSLIRQRGLEKELEVREEITSSVNDEVRAARQQVVKAAAELESLHNEYLSLKSAFEQSSQDTQRLQALSANSDALAAERRQKIEALEDELAATRTELDDLRTYVDGRKESWQQYEIEIAELQRELARMSDENRELREAPGADRESEIKLCRARIAEQAGELAACKQDLDTLEKDHARLECYANEIRQRLQDNAEADRDSKALRRKLEGKLATAQGRIAELTALIAEEQAVNQRLREDQELVRQQFERDLRQVRFELTSAQETIADHQTHNERLASRLVDSQDFQDALESHVGAVETKHRASVDRLKRRVRASRKKITEYEYLVRSKDETIAELTKQLAEQGNKISFTNELETALQKIDGHRQGAAAKPAGRVARQLIGQADGKELRFPLFRKRLSIGRTAHNDIQLNMRFVSRRHAVIATDDEVTRVIDWGSRNGVYVNNERVTERVLSSGDVITIGTTDMRYEERQKR